MSFDWQHTTLGQVCAAQGGAIQTGPFGSQLHTSDYKEFGIPVVMPTNIGDGGIVVDGIARIDQADVDRLSQHKLQMGDIVFSRRGDVTKNALIRQHEVGWFCGTGCLKVRLGDESTATAKFISYSLCLPDTKDWLIRHAVGATMPNLNTGILSAVPIFLPPLHVQLEIAAVLGALDDRITLLRETNATLEAIAQALFKSWFVDFDPMRAKMEGRAPEGMDEATAALFPNGFEESELGLVPRGWRVDSAYTVTQIIYGSPFASKKFNTESLGIPLIRIRDLRDESPGVFTPEEHPKGYLVQPGDIVVGMDGEFRAYLWGGEEAWLNQRVCVFVPKPGFPAAYVHRIIMPLLAAVEASETATTVIHLGKNDIDRFRVPVPDKRALAAFGHIADDLYRRIVAAKQSARTLATLRDTLLPRLISGQLRLPEAEALLEEAFA